MIYIIYNLLRCFCVIFPPFWSVFNKTALLSANPQIQELFFHVYYYDENRLHSNYSLSSETVSLQFSFSLFFWPEKKTYAYRHSIYHKNVISRLKKHKL